MTAVHGVDYPFAVPARAGLLTADGGWSRLPEDLDLSGRTAVVAVGSNAVPAVVAAKLAAACAGGWVPFQPNEIRGVAVAHSAHVSPGGYVPTTALADVHSVLTLVVSWFDDAQLTALDDTEPNYRRSALPAGCGVLGAMSYVSRWGVLAPGGAPLAPTSQTDVFRRLRVDPLLAEWLAADDATVVEALREPGLALRVRERFAALGWSRPTGLET